MPQDNRQIKQKSKNTDWNSKNKDITRTFVTLSLAPSPSISPIAEADDRYVWVNGTVPTNVGNKEKKMQARAYGSKLFRD